MQGYEASTYGDRMVDHDAIGWPAAKDEEAAVAFLLEVAKHGKTPRALELGVGTGRVAIPLARAGMSVTGIDASATMLRQLANKPEGTCVQSVQGDFADVGVEGPFDLVYAVQHTFFLLRTQDEQVRCFRNASNRLARGGFLVLQLFAPDPHRLIQPQSTDPLQVALDQVVLRVSQFDRVEQTVTRQYVAVKETGIVSNDLPLRLARRAGPDGPHGRPPTRGPLEWLVTLAVHRRGNICGGLPETVNLLPRLPIP